MPRCPSGVVLVRALGAGSVFEVARVRVEERRCILKRLRPTLLANDRARCAMRREREALARGGGLVTPLLVAFGEDEDGPYVLEEEISWPSLRQLALASAPIDAGAVAPLVSDAPIEPATLDLLVAAAFGALATFHARATPAGERYGLVHGDLAPDHIAVEPPREPGDARSRVCFLDLGMARWGDLDVSELGVDFGAGERGTLPFVAPELARGEVAPDQACDVFALAASLAFVALGREPCRETTNAARLVELAERGVDRAGLEACDRLTRRARAALLGALTFARVERTTTALGVLACLGA